MRISVALCTFNGERYLPQQLESLAEQARLPDELVACDDLSADGTLEVLEAFAERSPFPVRIRRNDRNLGATKNFEQAIGICSGDVVALCDQDDVWLPRKLDRIATVMETAPAVGFVFSDAELIDENGRSSGRRLWPAVGLTPQLRDRIDREGPLPALLGRRVVTGATAAFRTELRETVCPIPQSWPHDAWIATVTALITGWAVVDEPLIRYRIHGDQQIGISRARTSRPRTGAPTASDDHGDIAGRFEQVVERVSGNPYCQDAAALDEVRDLVRHHRIRADLPDARLRRVPIVLAELRRGGYRRRSRGTLSAVKDLVT